MHVFVLKKLKGMYTTKIICSTYAQACTFYIISITSIFYALTLNKTQEIRHKTIKSFCNTFCSDSQVWAMTQIYRNQTIIFSAWCDTIRRYDTYTMLSYKRSIFLSSYYCWYQAPNPFSPFQDEYKLKATDDFHCHGWSQEHLVLWKRWLSSAFSASYILICSYMLYDTFT